MFVYGTLLFPEVVAALIGRVPRTVPAAVDGWRAARLRGRPYPGLVPAPGWGAASGLVLSGLTAAERAIFDDFEGDPYETGSLVLRDGSSALGYLWRDQAETMPEDWDAAAFADRHLAGYVRRCAAWRAGRADPRP